MYGPTFMLALCQPSEGATEVGQCSGGTSPPGHRARRSCASVRWPWQARYRHESDRASHPRSPDLSPQGGGGHLAFAVLPMLRRRSGARAGPEHLCAAKNRTIIHESKLAKSRRVRACHRRRTYAGDFCRLCNGYAEHHCHGWPAPRTVSPRESSR
jgi:hypothetical protein